ncbi:MAG: hypothetical protein ACM3X7_05570 [Solirubrobacterales bacterium]
MSDKNKGNDETSIENINVIINDVNTVIDKVAGQLGIRKLKEESKHNTDATDEKQSAADINAAIIQTSQTLAALNSIKSNLCSINMDLYEKEYIANCIIPLLTTLQLLSTTGYNLATSASLLTTSPIVPRKKGEIKDTIHTVYSINKECDELYHILKKRLKQLNKEAEDNCCI